jgi:hypothetical protein
MLELCHEIESSEAGEGKAMKLGLVSAICLAFFSITAAAREELNTVRKFMHSYDNGNVTDRAIAEIGISQMEQGFAWMNAYLVATRREPAASCQPGNLALTSEQVIDIMRRETAKYPALQDKPIGLVLLRGLIATFPCEAQKSR